MSLNGGELMSWSPFVSAALIVISMIDDNYIDQSDNSDSITPPSVSICKKLAMKE